MKGRIFYLIKIYVFMALTFVVAKPVFMLCNGAGQNLSGGDYADVVWHGLSLDLSTALYLFIVPFLAVLVSLWAWRWNGIRKFLKVYYAIAAAVLSMAFVIDTSLYPFWGFKLDASALQYIDATGNAFASVSVGFVLLRVLVMVGIAFMLYRVMVVLTPKEKSRWRGFAHQHGGKRGSAQGGTIEPVRKMGVRLLASLAFLFCIPLMVLGLRGGLGISTSNVGQVYYSQKQFLNHSAVNPLFSFISSFGKSTEDVPEYSYHDETRCRELLAGIFRHPQRGFRYFAEYPQAQCAAHHHGRVWRRIYRNGRQCPCYAQSHEIVARGSVFHQLYCQQLAHRPRALEHFERLSCFSHPFRHENGLQMPHLALHGQDAEETRI